MRLDTLGLGAHMLRVIFLKKIEECSTQFRLIQLSGPAKAPQVLRLKARAIVSSSFLPLTQTGDVGQAGERPMGCKILPHNPWTGPPQEGTCVLDEPREGPEAVDKLAVISSQGKSTL